MTWVTTNGKGDWDNHGGKNYEVSAPGVYALADGSVDTLETFTPGCPPCGSNGQCVMPYGVCTCKSGYFGPSCSDTCPGAPNNICSGHGTCDEAGSCQCNTGWGNCGVDDCSVNVTNDPNNCGSCGNVCQADPSKGILTATCAASACVYTCAEGYILCPSGSCQKGDNPSDCPLAGCATYDLNQCSGTDTETPSSFNAAMWQTPEKGQNGYFASFQSYSTLQGYARWNYDPTHEMAVVQVWTKQKNPSEALTFSFDGAAQSSSNKTFCSPAYAAAQHRARARLAGESLPPSDDARVARLEGRVKTDVDCEATNGPIDIAVTGSLGSSLSLDPTHFIWGNAPIAPRNGDYRNGQKGSIVEMFGWPHEDVGEECAFLAQAGYLGAKLYPVTEQVMSVEPFQNVMNPWYFMYQPISYRFQGRMGNQSALVEAITRCRSVGVRMYADAVVNHLAAGGNDLDLSHRNGGNGWCTYWGPKNTSAALWFDSATDPRGVSPYFNQDFKYTPNQNTGLPPTQEAPAVPYGPTDFHCERVLNSWTDPLDLNAGWLDGLCDLNTEQDFVRQRIADFMTSLLSLGFSGFRMDAAKHIQPDDHVAIFSKLKDNLGGVIPDDFHVWMEVLTGGEGDMLVCNNASGYNYGGYLSESLAAAGFEQEDIDKIRIWADYYPKQPGLDCGNIAMNRKAIQNDDSDQQMPGSTSRDMGNMGCVLVSNCASHEEHRQFEVMLFTDPPGSSDNDNDYPIRMLLSSFYFNIGDQPYGLPDGLSECSKCQVDCESCTNSMSYTKAYQPDAVGYAGPVYTRTHRDPTIINAMRSWVHLAPTSLPKEI